MKCVYFFLITVLAFCSAHAQGISFKDLVSLQTKSQPEVEAYFATRGYALEKVKQTGRHTTHTYRLSDNLDEQSRFIVEFFNNKNTLRWDFNNPKVYGWIIDQIPSLGFTLRKDEPSAYKDENPAEASIMYERKNCYIYLKTILNRNFPIYRNRAKYSVMIGKEMLDTIFLGIQ
ncbi:MAG: hypothetical protein EOO16_00390 [Chitinophagaceae bacterium]|nr:MAG: hypothetical protein EOO16_00390 [Chitinophagaceae bacterium]